MRRLALLLLSMLAFPRFGAAADTVFSIEVNGQSREYFVHLPPAYDGHTPLPVLLVFHGGVRDAQSAIKSFGLDAKADSEGFIAVYPQGNPRAGRRSKIHLYWNSNHTRFTPDSDDLAFVKALLDRLQTTFAIDRGRIYSTGISNGAQMSYLLACRLADRIAAIASVSGSLETENCQPSRPVPILEFHGTADRFIPFNGGGRLGFQSVPQTLGAWLGIDQCPATSRDTALPDLHQDGTHVTVHDYGPCAAGTEVELVEIEGGGHNWPGVPLVYPDLLGEDVHLRFSWRIQRRLLGNVTTQIYAPDVMWNFLKTHSLP